MRAIKKTLLKSAKQLKYATKRQRIPDTFLHKNVPYFSQWESPHLVKQILEGDISTDDDPNWKNSGAKNEQEYHDWSWAGCAMACTKMIIAHHANRTIPLVKLGKKCVEYGGYTLPLKDSVGLLYRPYATYVQKECGWKATIKGGMPLIQVMHELSRGNYVLASVSPQIRHPQSKPTSKTGHLILVLGYDKIKQELYFHNPSGLSESTQNYAAISFKNFKKFYGSQGIVITV